jgi:hypothetical protein
MSDKSDVLRVIKEPGLRSRNLRKRARVTQSESAKLVGVPTGRPDKELARKFVALALDGLDRQLRRKQPWSQARGTPTPGH